MTEKDERPSNQEIADTLEKIATLLEVQDANPHRVRAYRNGAQRVRTLDGSAAKIVRSGDGKALEKLPDIGQGLAGVITRFVETGHSNLLERLQGEVSPERLFRQVPGIGATLAKRIANELDIQTLEGLEQAAHDGRLAKVEGFGQKRIRTVQVSLAGMLSRTAYQRAQERTDSADEATEMGHPAVKLLLDIDATYRRKADANELPTIAPKRFNPEGKSWLPIMHASRDGYDFTVLYSNTARAHELNKTDDWVVIYYERDGREDQATVVTATRGPLEGKRVVRGREAESQRFYK
jgi:hypothetical protein